MTPNLPRISIKTGIVVSLLIVFALYGFNRAKELIAGPSLVIQSPADGVMSTEANLEIAGTAFNISHLYLDGRQIFTDEDGVFDEKLLLAPGFNIIRVRATDRFHRTISKTRSVIYSLTQ